MLAHLADLSFEIWLSSALVASVVLFVWALIVGAGVTKRAEEDIW